MGIARLQAGIKWKCSKCKQIIPVGEGISINGKPYCEVCGLRFLKGFEKIASKVRELEAKSRRY